MMIKLEVNLLNIQNLSGEYNRIENICFKLDN